MSTLTTLEQHANSWIGDTNGGEKLGYSLDHKYTPNRFGFSELKGRDRIVLEVLQKARATDGGKLFKVSLALFQRYVRTSDYDGVTNDELTTRLFVEEDGTMKDYQNEPSSKKSCLTIFKRVDGFFAENMDWCDNDNEEDEDMYEDPEDRENINKNHVMFQNALCETEAGYSGNEGGGEKVWYYAGCIVFEPCA